MKYLLIFNLSRMITILPFKNLITLFEKKVIRWEELKAAFSTKVLSWDIKLIAKAGRGCFKFLFL